MGISWGNFYKQIKRKCLYDVDFPELTGNRKSYSVKIYISKKKPRTNFELDTIMNISNIDHNQLLSDLNNEKAKLFIPAILYVGILMLLGTLGNSMVLYFYGFKSKPSPSASFIIALAVFDLVSCIIGMPMEIADLRYFINFKSELACKILRSVTHFASISSGITLIVIAIDRYRRICKPFERQLNNRHVKIVCVLTGIISILLSWPAVMFNEVVKVEVVNSDGVSLTGKDCTTTKRNTYRPYMYAFNVVYLAAFVIITVILSVLYTFIGRQLFRHKKFRSYVAKGSGGLKQITVKANSGSDENLLPNRETSTLSNRVFEDPPDASGSVVDLKEFVTRGLTQVESDRPTSGYTAITGTTGLTNLTDLSGKSRRTLHSTRSMKSVTIDPSQNQVFPIEARAEIRPSSGGSWTSVDGRRPASASSFATFSSRPSSAALSNYSEYSRMTHMNGRDEIQDGDDLDSSEEGEDDKNERLKNKIEIEGNDGRQNIKIFEHDIDGETITVTTESVSSLENTFTEAAESDDKNVSDKNIETDENAENKLSDTNYDISITDYEQPQETALCVQKADSNILTHERPESTSSTKSSKTKRSKRSSVVTPFSSVTSTASGASRASTVKRIKRLFRSHLLEKGKNKTDTDKVKELRMKMLDINTVKYTLIMLVITVVFVVSFLPYLSLVIWRYYQGDHEVNILSDTELVLFQVGIRSIFINSSMNPLIYGGFNSKFRAFFYGICCSCCLTTKRNKKKGNQPRDQSDSTSGT